MSLTSPNFAVSQNYGDISVLTLEDTSTGTDNTLTGRLVYLRKQDGSYLVPAGTTTDFIFWPYSESSIDIDVLDKDYALDITVKWFSGSTISYTKTTLCLFTAYSELFLRQRTRNQADKPYLIGRDNYWAAKIKLRTLIDDAVQAVALINDQTIATYCLDEAKKITDNPSIFF